MTSKQTAEPLSFKETECQQRMLATPIPNADAKPLVRNEPLLENGSQQLQKLW